MSPIAKHFLNIYNECIKTLFEGNHQNTQFEDLFWQDKNIWKLLDQEKVPDSSIIMLSLKKIDLKILISPFV